MHRDHLPRLGLVADVQYADLDDQPGLRYRSTLARLERASVEFARARPAFVVQLGDVIEGRDNLAASRRDFERALAPFAALERDGIDVVHVLGNHCLALLREEWLERFGLERAYRSYVRGGWRLIVLDSLEVSLLGRPENHPRVRQAQAWLAEHPSARFPHAVHWNGAFGREQLEWLEAELAAAARAGEASLVVAHHPIEPAASRPRHRAWDHEDALAVLARAPRPVAWIAGHDHEGGSAVQDGVWHWTLRGMVAAGDGERVHELVGGGG